MRWQRRSTMTDAVHALPAHRGGLQGSGGLWIAAALFVAVLIAEAVVIALAAPTLPDIGALYVTVT
jgi:hypothetical protein